MVDEASAPDTDTATTGNGSISDQAPAGLKRSIRKAEKVGKDRSRVKQVLAEASTKALVNREKLGEAWDHLQTLFRLIGAWVTRRYTQVPWRVLVIGLAAVIYFVNPLDIVPDFLPFGLLDDIGVIGLAVSMMREDLTRFRAWEKAQAE